MAIADEMNFEAPLTSLVWITSFVSIGLTYLISYYIDSDAGRQMVAVVEAVDDHLVRNAGGSDDSGTGEGVYLDRVAAREGSGDLCGRRWSVAGHSVGIRGRKLLGVLAGH